MIDLAQRFVTEDERWRCLPPSACTTHARRISAAQQFDVANPARLLALAVISLCLEDYQAGRRCDLEVPFWARMADVPEAWIAEGLVDSREEALVA